MGTFEHLVARSLAMATRPHTHQLPVKQSSAGEVCFYLINGETEATQLMNGRAETRIGPFPVHVSFTHPLANPTHQPKSWGPEQKWPHLGGAALSPGGSRAPQTLPVAFSGAFFLPSTKDKLNLHPARPLWESHEPVVS